MRACFAWLCREGLGLEGGMCTPAPGGQITPHIDPTRTDLCAHPLHNILCARVPAGPRQHYCSVGLAVPGQVLRNLTFAAAAAGSGCAAACSADSSCSAFIVLPTVSGSRSCKLLAAFSGMATAGALKEWGLQNSSAIAFGCIAANEPYYCLPSSWDVRGSVALFNDNLANPEACRAECDTRADCTHYVYVPYSFKCILRDNAIAGSGIGANAVSSTDVRTCLKTLQHPDFGNPSVDSSGLALPHGQACYVGVALSSGSAASGAWGGVSMQADCAQQCSSSGNCGHWQLLVVNGTNGTCQIFPKGVALQEGYGPDDSVAVACLAGVTGTYECLQPRMAVAYTQLGAAVSGVANRTSCAQLCSAAPACVSFQYTAGGGTCLLHSTTFSGPSGTNGFVNSTASPQSFVVCLRTLSARALFGSGSAPVLSGIGFGSLPAAYTPSADQQASQACPRDAWVTGRRAHELIMHALPGCLVWCGG